MLLLGFAGIGFMVPFHPFGTMQPMRAKLPVSKEREQHFTLLADQAQKRSPCILLAFLTPDSFDRRVLDLSVGLGNCHSIKIECHVFDGWITFPVRAMNPDFHSATVAVRRVKQGSPSTHPRAMSCGPSAGCSGSRSPSHPSPSFATGTRSVTREWIGKKFAPARRRTSGA